MAREIKFRGKHKITGGWYYGYLYKQDNDWIITTDGYTRYVVDKNTIGQDTGLKDKNGKKIYEGDVVSEETDSRWVVKFIDGAFWFCDGFSKLKTPKDRWTYDWAKDNGYWKSEEIIGNLYETPELLNNKN